MTDNAALLFLLGSDRRSSLRRLAELARPGDRLWLLPGALAALPPADWPAGWSGLMVCALDSDWATLTDDPPPPELRLLAASRLVELVEDSAGPYALA